MSTLPPECQQLLISGYVLGNLSPTEALLFNEMLQENPDLIEQINLLQQVFDQAYTAKAISPPADLRDRILATAKAEVSLPANNKPAESAVKPQFRLSGTQILGALALAIMTILGIANYRLWRSIQALNTIEQHSEPITYVLSDQTSNTEATAKLIVNPDQLNGILQANNLPPLPPEKAYAVWTVVGKDVPYTTDDKGAILTAVFQVNESGEFMQEIALPQPHLESRTIKKIAITVENVLAPQVHQGSIFISTDS